MTDRADSYDVAVIGAGMAGMAAALFAAERGLSCIQVGNGGGILFASGLLDLLGVHPVAERRLWQSPLRGPRGTRPGAARPPSGTGRCPLDPHRVRDLRRGPGRRRACVRPAGRAEPERAHVDRDDQDHVRRAADRWSRASARWTRGHRACWWTSAGCASSARVRSPRR